MSDNESRISNPKIQAREKELELCLRPQVMEEYIGQDKVKENILISIQAVQLVGLKHDFSCIIYQFFGLVDFY